MRWVQTAAALGAALVLAASPACRSRPPERAALAVRNVPVAELLTALATRTGRAVLIDPSAAAGAEYARVTLVAPPGIDDATLARLLNNALAGNGLTVALTPDGWVVRRVVHAPAATTAAAALALGGDAGNALEVLARAAAGIRQRGPGEYELTEAARDVVVDNFALILQTARVAPHERGGRVTGIQLFIPAAHPLFTQLGLQNGDVLLAINGQDVSSPERALEIYSQARRTASWTVALSRDGTPVQLQYNLALP